MERHVPWSGTGCDRHERHHVLDKLSRSRAEVPDVDLVGAEIDAEYVVAGKIVEDLMRVRALLASGIGSGPVANALKVVGHRSDGTVPVDPENLKIAAGVARREKTVPRSVSGEMRRVLADCRLHTGDAQCPVRLA